MSINLTDELLAKTEKGKIASAKQVFLDGDKENLQQIGEKTHQLVGAFEAITPNGGASKADAVSYKNTTSGMTAVTAQGAIDELAAKNKSQDSSISTKAEKADVQASVSELKAKNTSQDAEIAKKANSADVASQMQTEHSRVNAELDKKFNSENIAQESGEAEDKVMSQKAVSTELGKKFNKENITQELGENETKVVSQKGVKVAIDEVNNKVDNTTNKTVFSANAEINSFIKECYIENWSGGDLYFGLVNTNDDGKVSIFIRDSKNNWFIAVYKQPFKDFYIAEKDETKLYIAVDKNIEINYNSQGGSMNVNKVSSRAFSLINSPMIKEKYFTDYTIENTNAVGDITSTKLSWKNFIYYKMINRTNLLTSWENEYRCKLEQFIVSLKVSYKYIDDKEKVEKYLSHLYLGDFHLAEDGFRFNLNNRSTELTPNEQWILYNISFCNKKEEGVQSYTVTYGDYTTTVTVNWGYYFESINPATFRREEIINYLNTTETRISVEESIKNIIQKNIDQDTEISKKANTTDVASQMQTEQTRVNEELNKKLNKENIVQELGSSEEFIPSQKCITESFDKVNSSMVNLKNILPNLCISENSLINKSFSKFEISNGKLNIVASGNIDTSIASRNDFNIPLKAGHKYNLVYKILFKDKVLLHSADVLSIIFWAYRDNEKADAYSNNLIQPEDIKPATQEWVNVNASFEVKADSSISTIELRKYNNTKTTDKILDVEISYIMLLDSTDSGLNQYQLREFLLQKDSFFEDIQIFKYYPIHQLYYNMKLRSLGDSLPETVSFQPWVANELGMKYSTEFEHNTKQIEYNGQSVTSYRSTWGSTRVAPVISSSTNERFMTNASIYMRAKSLKYDMPDVLIILAGYNDPKAGTPYIDGGTYVQPADYGINDAPYTGEEIDLVSDKTQTAPSFGASYRGMLEQIIKDNPRCRIILCGVPRGSGEANKFGKEGDWNEGKNKVIEKIAKEYGYPFVNLADLYGVNKFNYEYLTKDNLHFSNFGGRRVAMEILAKAF